jgi:hypothetical protein
MENLNLLQQKKLNLILDNVKHNLDVSNEIIKINDSIRVIINNNSNKIVGESPTKKYDIIRDIKDSRGQIGIDLRKYSVKLRVELDKYLESVNYPKIENNITSSSIFVGYLMSKESKLKYKIKNHVINDKSYIDTLTFEYDINQMSKTYNAEISSYNANNDGVDYYMNENTNTNTNYAGFNYA